MKMKNVAITEKEKNAVKKHTEAVVKAVQGVDIREGLVAYAVANGMTEDNARNLVENVIIPNVDEYNKTCREVDASDTDLTLSKINEKLHMKGLNDQEVAKYKLAMLEAIRKQNAADANDDNVLTEDELAMVDATELTDEMIEKIDELLVIALQTTTTPLHALEAYNEALNRFEGKNFQAASWELWEDNKLKYCSALAMCIARHNGEMPSVPDEITDENLVISSCYGVDVVNIGNKVSKGEMTADAAYRVLRLIGGIALIIGAVILLFYALAVVCAFSLGMVTALIESGMVVSGVLAAVAMVASIDFLAETGCDLLLKGVDVITHFADVAYDTAKAAVKKLYNFTCDKLVPSAKAGLAYVWDAVTKIVHVLRNHFRAGTRATVTA